MSKKTTKAADLSEAVILERAKSMVNQWMWVVSLQHDRIIKPRSQDLDFHPFGVKSFNEADVHFLVIALRRLRQAATTIKYVPQHWDSVRKAINNFDAELPWLKRVRDVFEHLEDYAVDSNRRRTNTSRRELQVWFTRGDGMEWLGYDVNWKDALSSANDLCNTVNVVCDSFAKSKKQE